MPKPPPHPPILLLAPLALLTACSALSQNFGSYDLRTDDQIACRPDPNSNPVDDTLLTGKQPSESKRHADDWAQPLLEDSLDTAGQLSR